MCIISKFNTQSIKNKNNEVLIDIYHIILDNDKILDLYHNEDLRFFLKTPQILNKLSKEANGIVLKLSSWDYLFLHLLTFKTPTT